MSSIRPSTLQSLLRESSILTSPSLSLPSDHTTTDPTGPNPDNARPQLTKNPESLAVHEVVQDILGQLDILSPATFNIAELDFKTTSLASAPSSELLDIETLLDDLVRGGPSRRFISIIRSLQSLVHDLDDLLADAHRLEDSTLTQECEDALGNVNAELNKLIAAAREARAAQAMRRETPILLGVRRVDFSSPINPAYRLTPIATAVITIVAVIHCIMNVSRTNCNFILRAMRGLLRLVVRTENFHLGSLIKNIEKIPVTLDTAIRYLGVDAGLVFYAVCPRCCILYPENEPIPERCSNTTASGQLCSNPLLVGRRRGGSSWNKPRRRYSHQPLEVWLAHFLNRPEIEDLIENVRPCPQAECTDFWGASYLNNFPGPGEKSFFDAPTEDLRLAFMIYHDFANPLTNKMAGKQKSVGPVMLVCLNLPPQVRYNRENIYMASIIPGPSEPSREQINHFMRPITQNLKEHYASGVWISRTHKYPRGRHVRSAAMIESMDLLASRAWGGIGPPTHKILCSFCGVHQDEIDYFDKVHSRRNMRDHAQHVHLWLNATDSKEREKVWKSHAARYSEMLCFPWWSPFSAPIAPMHWTKNILEKQLRENMGWSWTAPTGIPTNSKLVRLTPFEMNWARAAMTYCTSEGLCAAKLTEPILRHLCIERKVFNVRLPKSRMLIDLNNWRKERGIIDASGELAQQLPPGWADDKVAVAKAEYYLSKTKKAEYLVQNTLVNDLKLLCAKYQLSDNGVHHELASRLIEYYAQTPRKPELVEADEPKSDNFAVLGHEVMAAIRQDMEHTIIPSLHIPHFLETLGPAPRFSENPSEMFIGMLQDIPMNWRFGELEHTLHKEFVASSNLQALLQQPQMVDALNEVGEVVQDYLEARSPGHTGVYAKGWNVTHPSTPSVLSDEIHGPLARFCSDRQAHPPTRRQFMCTKVQNGHVVYQPESNSIGNSQVLFEVPGTHELAAGRIESIILQSEKTDSPHPPQIMFLLRPFAPLSDEDRACDPYSLHPIIGRLGSKIAGMYYDKPVPGLPVIVQAKDIISHVATYRYQDTSTRRRFSAPCIAVLSLNWVSLIGFSSFDILMTRIYPPKKKHARLN